MKKLLLFLTPFFMHGAMAQINITATGISHTENFDTLIMSGNKTWTNNKTITGWYATETIIYADNGANTFGKRLFSYGTTSNTDRALGGTGFSSLAGVRFGVKLVNNTGDSITSLDISYMGEQWRLEAAGTQVLSFDYQNNATSLTTGTWTPVTQLDFNSPQSTGTTGAIDGNLPANQTFISYTLAGPISPGDSIMLRWTKWGGNSPGLAIDSFAVIAHNNNPSVGISEMPSKETIHIYPNPNAGNFQLAFLKNVENATIKIFNLLGKEVFMKQLNAGTNAKYSIQLSDLSDGIYFVNILSGDKSDTQKLVIRK